jgi:sulfatase modifying factor 1
MERTQAVFRMKLWHIALVTLATATAITACCAPSANLSGHEIARTLQPNVVRIEAGSPEKRNGFGFVVSQDSGHLYIVTADHVVSGKEPDDIDTKPSVFLFQDPGKRYEGDVKITSLRDDLALLSIERPPTFTWNNNVQSPGPAKPGIQVWFIGKGGDWEVPILPGVVNRSSPTIRIERLGVRVGTSGAPLISQDGILGMIVKDETFNEFSEATPLSDIQRMVEQWHYPWQLTPKSTNCRPTTSPILGSPP